MATPSSVKRQSSKADQLQKELIERRANTSDQPADPPEPPDKGDTANAAVEPSGRPEQPEQGQPEGQNPQEPTIQPHGDSEDFKARYLALKGKYDAEVPRLHAEVRTLRNARENDQGQINQLREEVQKIRQQAPPAENLNEIFTEDEIEEYGEDTLRVMQKAASRLAERRAQELREQFDSRLESVRTETRETGEQAFLSALHDQVPDWQTINADTRFHEWLATTEPLAGVERQQLLEDAHAKLDAARVIGFFKAYKKEAMQSSGAPPPENDRKQGPPDTSHKVMPGRATAPDGVDAQDQKPVYTRDQIKAFYAELSKGKRGKYFGREKDARAIEKDIMAATSEGRVQG